MSATMRQDSTPSRPVSMQQKLLHQHYNVKPITIRTNSMNLPGFSQPRSQSRFARILQYGQQLAHKAKRYHRIRTRRGGYEGNWYRFTAALLLLVTFFAITRLFSSITSFRFSRSTRLGPRMTETLQAIETLSYISSTGSIVTLDKEKLFSGVRRSRLYQGSRIRRQIMDTQKDPIIRVINADSLDEALRLKRQGYKPIVLDMANREFPGGDYRADGTTQEAGLFLRTNLYQCLDTEPRRSEFYPLPSQGAVYCPNMVVIRKSSQDKNEFMDRPEWMSFLAMAPLRNPPLVPNGANEMILGERAAIITKKKIQNMFRIALENGHDAIVLSAFGCGRLHNPAESVANIFKEVIHSNYMGGVKKGRTFGAIVFAITDYTSLDSDLPANHNYKTFKEVMESPYIIEEEEESES
ncbi:hypothetical protein BG015_007985 [Linnemannia schmuckeri]|uniref:Microbial-type PARG catalytic domain-containing protein n=1 Tax=Linnemannia schmuckeri TaxID=64567 RepID=A0A9P5S0D0_9FUNG|nr:hypothetical protein BG015_007985 [Linnemannia schmuckeri]